MSTSCPPRRRQDAAPIPQPQEAGDLLSRCGLRASAEGIPNDHPDRTLLLAIRAAAESRKSRDAAYDNWNARPAKRTGTRAEAEAQFRVLAEENEKAQAVVVKTRASTPAGALAKLQFVLDNEEFDLNEKEIRCGKMMSLPLSAMRDALAMLR